MTTENTSKQVRGAAKPPAAGKGRVKGTPNKTTALLKDAILRAAEAAGEDKAGKGGLIGYCTFLAKEEPKAFTTLLGKVLPMQVTGPNDGPIAIDVSRLKGMSDEELSVLERALVQIGVAEGDSEGEGE